MLEAHIKELLKSSLPDLKLSGHLIKDKNDLGQILDVLHQQVKQSTVNLPKNKPIGEINWSGRLILAELKAWHEERGRKQS